MMDDYTRRLKDECERAEVLWNMAFQGAPPPKKRKRAHRPNLAIKYSSRRKEYRTLIKAGGTALEIATEMGVTVGAVYSQAGRLGLNLARSTTPRSRRDPERDKRIIEMCAAGATTKEIAAEVGMSVGGLRNRCTALGVTPGRERARRWDARP